MKYEVYLNVKCILSCFYNDSWSVGISFKIFLTFRTVFFTLCNTTTLDCVTCLLWVVIFHTLLVPLGLKSVKPINTFFKHDRFGKRQKILPLQIHKSVKWPSYDIHSAGLTKQIKLVFKSDLSLFAKSNFFQISQTGKPQIQKLTNVPNTLKCNHK